MSDSGEATAPATSCVPRAAAVIGDGTQGGDKVGVDGKRLFIELNGPQQSGLAGFAGQLAAVVYLPPARERFGELAPPLAEPLAGALDRLGVGRLWAHQADGLAAVRWSLAAARRLRCSMSARTPSASLGDNSGPGRSSLTVNPAARR